MTDVIDTPDELDVDAYAEKVFGDVLGAMNVAAITLGVRLGWYDALAAADSMTSVELAAATDSDERYAREWLEQQTVTGYLRLEQASDDGTLRRYSLGPAGAAVMADRDSLAFMAPFATFVSALGKSMDALVDVYRSGEGIGWHEHGDGARCGQAAANRPMFLHQLANEYLASIPDVADALAAGGRVADVGCGMGWSSIGIARAFPAAVVHGFDIDEPSVDHARKNAAESGVSERVRFDTVDVGELEEGGYDLVLALECIHDMPDPVSVLTSMRAMAGDDGAVIVMDERVPDVFTGASDDPVEQIFYGFSLICCLPDGRNAEESVATGTVMRRPTFERYATQAGFDSVEVLPIENDFFRFYRLR
ncbi:MAG: methyltransferase domain-containing protein [Actinomycetota bacterium]